MADFTWTPSQQDAIDAGDRTLLVSAAAGSGKTAVLTERIIKKLQNGTADINRMLIVTFTNAAAKELKSRITKRLSEALKSDPANTYLAKQLSCIPSANIRTIDSFCIDLVKSNFDKLGLPCGMRIADEAEIDLLKNKLMNEMFDELYDKDSPFEGFDRFTDCFITDKDEELPKIFLGLHESLSTMTEGLDLIPRFADLLAEDAKKPFLQTTHGSYLRSYTKSFVDSYLPVVKKINSMVKGCSEKNLLYIDEYERILGELQALEDALNRCDYLAIKSVVTASKAIKLNNTNIALDFPDEPQIKDVKNSYNSEIESLRKDFYSETEEQIAKCYEDTEKIYRSIHRLLSAFDERLKEEKLKRKIMDFNDVERYALDLLYKDGGPTEAAKAYGARFDEIYIDEYQDINELQDTIFTSISGSAHRFMVGDIKQSIYGFRGSQPDIFAGYRERFPTYDKNKNDDTGTIFLSNNFRCSKNIITFCNNIFGRLMSNIFGGVEYLPEDDLVPPEDKVDTDEKPVELILVEKGSELTEEQVVARRIKELIDEGHSPKDIVILLRKMKDIAYKYEEALKELNIPCFNAAGYGFFANPEVLLVMCLLNVIDNPRRDVHLAGALQSPIFGFTLEDMVEIRRYSPRGYLYDSLLKWYEATEDPKGKYFFDLIEDLRTYSMGSPIDKLIWYLYTKTSMLSLYYAEKNGEESRANLMMLYEYARTFESGSFKGLYNFILYVNNLIENTSKVKEAKTDTAATPTVKIMTIHLSKGLEFPICFVSKCNKLYTNYNLLNHRDKLILDSQLGIAVYTPEEHGLCRINGILRRIIKQKKENDEAAEELRLLYVALTRAKNRLIVTGSCNSTAEKLYENCRSLAATIGPYNVVNCKNYLSLVRLATLYAENDPCWALHIEHAADNGKKKGEEVISDEDSAVTETIPSDETSAPAESEKSENHKRLKALFEERFRHEYSFSATARLPSKMAVSRLYPSVLDEEETPTPTAPMRKTPRFLEETATVSGAERGTATHVFMQFCDFENVVKNGVDAEIDRLIKKRFIPETYADMIRRDTLEAFFESPLFGEMQNASDLQRELRFNITLPAADFTEDEKMKESLSGDSVLVQGVMDSFFVDKNGDIVIVDYKTDAFTDEQKKDPAKCEAILRARHGTQLGYYRLACKQLLGRDAKKTLIWSFDLGKEIEV